MPFAGQMQTIFAVAIRIGTNTFNHPFSQAA